MSERIPQVIFKYAYPLDRGRRRLYEVKDLGDYPDREEIEREIENWRKLWQDLNEDNQLLKQIIELTGITYPRDIEAYVIGGGLGAMSTPLILPVTKVKNSVDGKRTELIIHEVLHRFVGDKEAVPEVIDYWNMVREKYADEATLTQNHIIIYALLETMLADILPDSDTRDFIHKEATNYFRALEIVREKGPDEIIAEFRKLTKET